MIHELASRQLADALFLEGLGVDDRSLISATKLILMELEEVSCRHAHATRLAKDGTDGVVLQVIHSLRFHLIFL